MLIRRRHVYASYAAAMPPRCRHAATSFSSFADFFFAADYAAALLLYNAASAAADAADAAITLF